MTHYISGLKREDTRPESVICREKLLYILESAYPNVLAVEDLVRYEPGMLWTVSVFTEKNMIEIW